MIFISDDLSAQDIGAYGSQDAHSPNIDALAKEGMVFRNAYTATAMCVTARSMLYTGVFPVKNGAYPNHSVVKPGTKSLVHYLTALGYRVGLAGKLDVGPNESFPFQAIGSNGSVNFSSVRKFINSDTIQPYCLVFGSHSPHSPWPKNNSLNLNEVKALDDDVDSSIKIINASKQKSRTAFLFLSEHGSSFPGAKWTCYEPGLKVGMILRWPDIVKPGSLTDAKIEYPDLVPTLIAAAGGNLISGLDGQNFLSVILGKKNGYREFIYGVHTQLGTSGSPSTGYAVSPFSSVGKVLAQLI